MCPICDAIRIALIGPIRAMIREVFLISNDHALAHSETFGVTFHAVGRSKIRIILFSYNSGI